MTGNAIELVFPDAAHRWCMWHVMQNCRKHLGKRKEWGEIYKSLQDVLHDSFSIDEFEERWNSWVSDFSIGSVEWVQRMFSDRSKWCPVYFKSWFWAGMSSTQRSEGMHHYFKGYVNINTCLSEFVEKYAKAICRRIAEEEKDKVKGKDRHSVVSSRHAFEPIFEKLYSRPKYMEVHDELIDMAGNIATKVGETDTEVLYDVLSKTFRVGWTTKRVHRVVFEKQTTEVHCECKNFEFRGILCSHALRVFWVEETAEVPGKYILDRWRKDLPRKYITHIYPEAAVMGQVSLPAQRFQEMQSFCEGISCMVMHDEELHNDVLGLMKNIKEKLTDKIGLPDGIGSFERGTVGKVYSKLEPTGSTIRSSIGLTVVDNDMKDPVDRRGRGKAPGKRKMSTAEIIGRRSKAKHKEAPSSAEFSPCTPVKVSSRMYFMVALFGLQLRCLFLICSLLMQKNIYRWCGRQLV